ncbi:MAG: hypothetical protein GY820_36480 [Gammaproteobacteria bacterium]|nr:hypothetical protein [Gammaproteobacteria bacterium]
MPINFPMQVTADALRYSMQLSKSVFFMQRYQPIDSFLRYVTCGPYGSMACNRKISPQSIASNMVNWWTKFY